MGAFEDITRRLPELSPTEIASLRQRLAALASLGGGGADVPRSAKEDSDEAWMLQVICDAMSSLGLERVNISMLRSSSQMPAFRKKLPMLTAYFEPIGTIIERKAIMAIGVDMLYKNLGQMGLPISTRTIMAHIHRLPSVINNAFPGYAASGLLPHVIRSQLHAARKVKKNGA